MDTTGTWGTTDARGSNTPWAWRGGKVGPGHTSDKEAAFVRVTAGQEGPRRHRLGIWFEDLEVSSNGTLTGRSAI